MATELHDNRLPTAIGSGGADKYDWDKWLIAGKHWIFRENIDYPGVTMEAFRQRVRGNAADRGLKAITRKLDDTAVEAWIEARAKAELKRIENG